MSFDQQGSNGFHRYRDGVYKSTWWCHQMETFSPLLVICAGDSLVTGEPPAQKPVSELDIAKLTPCYFQRFITWLLLITMIRYLELLIRQWVFWYISDTKYRYFRVSIKLDSGKYSDYDDVIKWKHFPRYWHFVGESMGHRWIPLAKTSGAELCCFLWSAPIQIIEQTTKTSVIWDAITLIMTSL